jgi:hypothetical protein
MGVLTKHLFQKPSPPVAPEGGSLGGLEHIIMRALEKHPDDRFASMSAFAWALDRWTTGEGAIGAPEVASKDRARIQTPKNTAERIEVAVQRRVDEEVQRVRKTLVMVGALLLVVGGVLVVVFLRRRSEAEQQPPAALGVVTEVLATSAPSRAPSPTTSLTPIGSADEPQVSAPTSSGTAASPAVVVPSSPSVSPTVLTVKKATPPPPRPRPPVGATSPPPPAPAPQSTDSFRDPWAR